MPLLMREYGIERWMLGFELVVRDGEETPAASRQTLKRWLAPLRDAADIHGIRFHVNDEFDFFKSGTTGDNSVRAKRIFDPDFLIRVEPAGYIRVGREVTQAWSPDRARRWNPDRDNIVDVVGYRSLVDGWRRKRRPNGELVGAEPRAARRSS